MLKKCEELLCILTEVWVIATGVFRDVVEFLCDIVLSENSVLTIGLRVCLLTEFVVDSWACDRKVAAQRSGGNTISSSACSVTRSNNSRLTSSDSNAAYSRIFTTSGLFVSNSSSSYCVFNSRNNVSTSHDRAGSFDRH